MVYRKYDNTYVVRLEIGEEVLTCLKKLAIDEKITLAYVTGIGATNDATLGVLSIADGKYCSVDVTGDHEITAIAGNITTMNDEPYLHLHMTLAGIGGAAVGGHLNKAVISATAEIFVTVLDGVVDRFKSTEGPRLNLLKL